MALDGTPAGRDMCGVVRNSRPELQFISQPPYCELQGPQDEVPRRTAGPAWPGLEAAAAGRRQAPQRGHQRSHAHAGPHRPPAKAQQGGDHQGEVRLPAAPADGGAGEREDQHQRGGHAAHEVPRQLPAGPPRDAQHGLRQGLHVHDAHAAAGGRGHQPALPGHGRPSGPGGGLGGVVGCVRPVPLPHARWQCV